MNYYIRSRIEKLQERAAQMSAAYQQRRRDEVPFAEFMLNEILGAGNVDVIFYPQGRRGQEERWSGTLEDSFKWADRENITVFVDMINTPLWSHVFYQKSRLYTAEQKASFLELDKEKYPEVSKLYKLDSPEPLIDFLAAVPQFLHFPAQDGGDSI